MAHPHVKAIENMNPAALVSIIEESKMTYVRENLSVFLHRSQIVLLKQVRKHEKPHHKRIRIREYEKADKDDLFNMHLALYLKKYEKLAKIGLIEIDKNPENGLAYDCTLTQKGLEVLDEIDSLERKWEDVVNINGDDLEVLRKIALDSFEISYNHKKKKGFIF
jgi:tryptophanyl-tRNA synthetase